MNLYHQAPSFNQLIFIVYSVALLLKMIIDCANAEAEDTTYQEADCASNGILIGYVDHNKLGNADHRQNKSVEPQLFGSKGLVKAYSNAHDSKEQNGNADYKSLCIIAKKADKKDYSKLDACVELFTATCCKVSWKVNAGKCHSKYNVQAL